MPCAASGWCRRFCGGGCGGSPWKPRGGGEGVLVDVVDVALAELFEDGAGGVEVPVVVEVVGAGFLGAAFGCEFAAVAGVGCGVVDAGGGGDEVSDGGVLFDGEEALDVVEVEVFEGGVEIDGTVFDVLAVEHGEDAFAYGGNVGDFGGAAVGPEHVVADSDNHAGGVAGFDDGVEVFQSFFGEAEGFWAFDGFPFAGFLVNGFGGEGGEKRRSRRATGSVDLKRTVSDSFCCVRETCIGL